MILTGLGQLFFDFQGVTYVSHHGHQKNGNNAVGKISINFLKI